MSKHLGQRSTRRLPRASRGLAVGVGGFVALNVVTLGAIVHGIGQGRPADDALAASSGETSHSSSHAPVDRTPSSTRQPQARPDAGTLQTQAASYHPLPGTTLSLKPAVVAARLRAATPTEFRVSTFNLLGASHTGRGGNHKGFAAGATRMGNAVTLLRSFDVDVVGFQEMEPVQFNTFNRLTGNGWGTFPGPTLDRGSIRQSIAWRLDTWKLVSASSIAIPYFHGQNIRMPVVLLENLTTHEQIYFANFHNPATTKSHGNNQRWRTVAEGREVALVNSLRASSGLPVIITGDMNERGEYFSRMANGTDMCSANAVVGAAGGCFMPRRMDVDWIWGSPEIAFSDYVSDQGSFVRRTTDHPIVVATGTIAPANKRR